MALSNSDLSELLDALRVGEGVDLIREIARWVLQELIETEASEVIGAGCYERVDGRLTERNGHRPKTLSTTRITRVGRSANVEWLLQDGSGGADEGACKIGMPATSEISSSSACCAGWSLRRPSRTRTSWGWCGSG